ncbi:MAG TPA: hypothetical protein PKZ43_10335 [Bacteroidales bacterium]|nr:hypothetical protein [Bacteroidales bacterium]HQH19942.1 hypothetical protein [Bacteroidales bacterium]HQI45361.1 hypothetical protein [Bacteroidales bacterium]
MFKYDNQYKKKFTKKIIDELKKSERIIISEQSAGKIEYMISQRQIMIDSIEIEGEELETGRPLLISLNINKLAQQINNN